MSHRNLKPQRFLWGLCLLAWPLQGAWYWPWEAYTAYQDGARAYEDKRYADSIPQFERGVLAEKDAGQPHYNLGNAYYQDKKYDKAIASYQNALKYPLPDQLAGSVYYNLGNTLYRQGQKDGNPVKNWQLAIDAYEKALNKSPQDKEAQENRDFVKEQLQKLQSGQGNSEPNSDDKSSNSANPHQPNGSPPPSSAPNGKPNPSPDPGQSAAPSSPGSTQPNPSHSGNPQESPPKYSQQEVQRFLERMEQAERHNRAQQMFRRFPQKQPATGNLFNMTPEQLMTLSPEELEKLFSHNRPDSSRDKDW